MPTTVGMRRFAHTLFDRNNMDPSHSAGVLTTSILIADWVIRLALSAAIIMRGRPVGFTLAWLSVVLSIPLLGAVAYLMFGELRLGRRRAAWAERIHGPYREWLTDLHRRRAVDWGPLGDSSRSLGAALRNRRRHSRTCR